VGGGVSGGVGWGWVMPDSSTPKVAGLSMATFGVGEQCERCRLPERKHHTKCDERKVAVQQHRTVNGSERPDFLGHSLCFRQKGIAKQAAERHIAGAFLTRRMHHPC